MEKRITLSTTLLLAIRTGNKVIQNTTATNQTKGGYAKVDAATTKGKSIQLNKIEALVY